MAQPPLEWRPAPRPGLSSPRPLKAGWMQLRVWEALSAPPAHQPCRVLLSHPPGAQPQSPAWQSAGSLHCQLCPESTQLCLKWPAMRHDNHQLSGKVQKHVVAVTGRAVKKLVAKLLG